MFFLNLPAGEFFALLLAAGGIISAFYLFEKAKSRRIVSTLRFWQGTGAATAQRRRARVQEPWSLLLQLAALLLLLLAVAGAEWGFRDAVAHNHVLLVDASASASAPVLAEEKRLAAQYLKRLNSGDRVMVVEAAGTVLPLSPFTAETEVLQDAVRLAKGSDAGLNLIQALHFADAARRGPQGQPGEVVYIGPARIRDETNASLRGLRIIPVAAPAAGVAFTELVANRGPEPNVWNAVVGLRNYSQETRRAVVATQFGVSKFAPRPVALSAGQTAHLDYEFTAGAAGKLRAVIESGDPGNQREVSLALPDNGPVSVLAFTKRPALLAAFLGSNPRLQVRYLNPSEYRAGMAASVLLFDQFVLPRGAAPGGPALWLDPPVVNSPFTVQQTVADRVISRWANDDDLTRGLHAVDLHLARAHVFEPATGLEEIAGVVDGPVGVARNGAVREAGIGFDVLASELRFQGAAPLLMANLLHWLVPKAFASEELLCLPAGLQKVELNAAESNGFKADRTSVRVEDEQGHRLPFTIQHENVEFFAGSFGMVRVKAGTRTREISIGLPEVAGAGWRPAGTYAMGLPPLGPVPVPARDLWRWLSVAGALLLAVEWFWFGRTAGAARAALKIGALAVLLVALVAPVLRVPFSRVAVAALVDGSASIPRRETDRATNFVQQLRAQQGGNTVLALPFAGEVGARLSPLRTDIEGGLLQGLAALPANYTPRLLLFSDGNENEGSSTRAVAGLARAGVPVDVVPLGGAKAGLRVTSVAIADEAYAGEQVPLQLGLASDLAPRVVGPGTLSLAVQGHVLATQPVTLEVGQTVLSAHVRMKASGPVLVTGTVTAASGAMARFDRVVQMRRAKLLYLSQDEPNADANLLAAFAASEFDVSRDGALLTRGLADIQLVVMNNVDLNSFNLQQKQTIEQYVTAGGGLLLIGGEHQVYKEDKEMDVLDRALPAKLGPPRNPEGICVALILDKSSSMEGRKIELARLSAIGVVDNLKPKDTIGVLIFDNSYQWAVPMQKAIDKAGMQKLISGITPDGGTQIAPALTEAYHKVQRVESAYKHIVLLTDGISEEGDSLDLAKEANAHNVTISTVGLGQDVNRSYLEKVATASGGKSYFLNNPQGLEQILLKDVKDYSGSTAVEKPLTPQVKEKAEVLANVDIEHAPALRGYVRYDAKPQSETLLTIDPEKKDPLFVRWQYGLGRVGVWTSDAKSRWADAWMKWPGFDAFWGNVARDLLDRQCGTQATAQVDTASGELQVTYRLRAHERAPKTPVFVFGPDGFVMPVSLQEVQPGTFRGIAQMGARTGLFTVRPVVETTLFPEVGAYRAEEELRETGVNEPLLRMLAESTGGRYAPEPAAEFLAAGSGGTRKLELWPGLLALVIALTLAELVARKWRSVVGPLRSRIRESDSVYA